MAPLRQKLVWLSKELLNNPTAPYREQAVRRFIFDFCKTRNIRIRQDDVGSLIATYGAAYRNPVFAFTAHMDHPGFIVEKDAVRKRTTALFYGGVGKNYFKRAQVKIFTATGSVKAQVTRIEFNTKKRFRRVCLNVQGDVRKGDFGMWDLLACRVRGDRLYSRACDDLMGCVSILMLLDELYRRKIRKKVQAVFSVAEEAGLHGVKHICQTGAISKKTFIVAIETSSVIPSVKMGDGVVIRVGDRSSIFTPGLTDFLLDAAGHVRSADKTFQYQRKLMDAGTCESTIYNRFGYVNAAVCISLGNYHNQNRRTQKIAPEYVSVSDLENMVKLFLSVVKNSRKAGDFLKHTIPQYKRTNGKLGEFFCH